MTTVTEQEKTERQEQMAASAFEAFVAARMPAHLQQGALPPSTWPFGQETWESFRDAAAKLIRIQARGDFLLQFVQGWTEREVLGDRDYGQEVYADGRPKRRMPSEVPASLLHQADAALAEAGARGLHLDTMTEFALERAVDSPPAKVQGAIDEVRSLCNAYDSDRRAQTDAGLPIEVHRTFAGPGGIIYQPGRYRIAAEDIRALAGWVEQVEHMAKQHGSLESVGQHGEWPPFAIPVETSVRSADLWQGA